MTNDTHYKRLVVAVAFCGTLLVCALMYANVFRHQSPPKWDEAQHIVFGWQIWADQADGSLVKLLKDSHAQFYWPFLHSWWVALFMKAFDVTDRGARLSSFAAMLMTVPLAFWAGKGLFEESVPWAGLSAVALLLMLASLPGLAAQCMIELPATMLSFFALLMYILAEDHQTAMTHACFGCVLAAVFLTKYNFGLALIGAFGAVAATELLLQALEGIIAFTPGGSDTVDLARVERLLEELSVDMVVTVNLQKASPFYGDDYRDFNAWKQKYVDAFPSVPTYHRVAAQDYPAGISAIIYRRRL